MPMHCHDRSDEGDVPVRFRACPGHGDQSVAAVGERHWRAGRRAHRRRPQPGTRPLEDGLVPQLMTDPGRLT